jgi:large subunit ribosomal protein L18
MIQRTNKNEIRGRIHKRIRYKVRGTAERPRLAVFRSLSHIYAQIIDDTKGQTLVSAASSERALLGASTGTAPAAPEEAAAKGEKTDAKVEKSDAKTAKVEAKAEKSEAKGEKGDAKGEKKSAKKEKAPPAKAGGGNLGGAKLIGQAIAGRAKEKGIKRVVFDRGGYIYHGRVKALADAAREAGLEF